MEETSIHKLQHEKDENVFQLCRFSADCSYIIEEFSELMPTYHLFEQVEESVKTRPFFWGYIDFRFLNARKLYGEHHEVSWQGMVFPRDHGWVGMTKTGIFF